jgi:hypothetical protein
MQLGKHFICEVFDALLTALENARERLLRTPGHNSRQFKKIS